MDADTLERTLEALRERVEGSPLGDALALCVQSGVGLLGVTGAGLMMIDGQAALRSVAASDETGYVLEETQERWGEGPCVDALVHDQPVVVEDLAADERWPRIRKELAGTRVRAVLGVPVHVAGGPVGSLNVYRDAAHEWSERESASLHAYGGLVEGVLAGALRSRQQSELATRLRQGLEERVTVERAVGYIMGRDGVDAVAAFNRLRRGARDAGRRVAEAAAELLRETRA